MSLIRIQKQLIDTLNYIPLHTLTLDRLSRHINTSTVGSKKLHDITSLFDEYLKNLQVYKKSKGKKNLQKLIWFTYFHWDNNYYEDPNWFNRLSPHLQILVDEKIDLTTGQKGQIRLFNYWPIKPQFPIPNVDKRYGRMSKKNGSILSPKTEKLSDQKGATNNFESLSDNQTDFLMHDIPVNNRPAMNELSIDDSKTRLEEYQRHFNTIQKQLTFLKINQMCKDSDMIVRLPFELVPERKEHVKKLVKRRYFKKKLSTIRHLFLREYPFLNKDNFDNLDEITNILNNSDSKMRKLYYTSCQDLYIMKDHGIFEKPIKWW